MKTYTKEQKAAYFKKLRQDWRKAKELADVDEITAIMINHGLQKFSPYSFAYVQMQMNILGLEGVPYIDCKTFQGWEENGFRVKKGEKSQLGGIVWRTANGKQASDEDVDDEKKASYVFPKAYALFHKSQVEEINA